MNNFDVILGSESYKNGSFFYEINENNNFDINLFNTLIENLKLFNLETKNRKTINKKIISHLYIFMWLLIWSINDIQKWKYKIKWIPKNKSLIDFYEILDSEIINIIT